LTNHANCPGLSETLVRDLAKWVSRTSEIRNLPFEMMERAALLARLAAIGQMEGAV
jgi:hypothetical protein